MVAAYMLLLVAIGTEVAATSALPRARSFHDPLWSAFVILGYAVSAWLLSVVVTKMPVSTVYAIWSGVGTAAIALIGAVWLGESWTWVKVVAIGLVIVGLVLLNLQDAHPH